MPTTYFEGGRKMIPLILQNNTPPYLCCLAFIASTLNLVYCLFLSLYFQALSIVYQHFVFRFLVRWIYHFLPNLCIFNFYFYFFFTEVVSVYSTTPSEPFCSRKNKHKLFQMTIIDLRSHNWVHFTHRL